MLVHAAKETRVRVVFLVGLHLNGRVVDIELFLECFCDAVKGIARVSSNNDVSREDWLVVGKRPQVEVVDFFDEGKLYPIVGY